MPAERLVTIPPEILFLTRDQALLKAQLQGRRVTLEEAGPLLDNISTDEITPGWTCFWYDDTLGDFCLVGLRGGTVQRGDVRSRCPAVVVSGLSKGCGSSRETAPYAERAAGVRLVVARTLEKIYRQNCHNIGLLTSTDLSVLDRIQRGEPLPVSTFTRDLDALSTAVVGAGGLFAYNKQRLAGVVTPPAVTTGPRPMTAVEKIVARHAVVDSRAGQRGVPAVAPGDALFCAADLRFSHEYVTPMAEAQFLEAFGPEARVQDPATVVVFRDHLTYLGQVMPESQRKMGLLERAQDMATRQEAFALRQGIRLYGEVRDADGSVLGSEAICHNAVLEDLARPGDLVIGSDSHTCTAGAVGCFAFGVGSTDLANAWFTGDVRVTVPPTTRYQLAGRLPPSVTAKDLALWVLAQDHVRQGHAIGHVLEFGGPGAASLSVDERATLTNMAVEAGATTGLVEADDVTVDYLCRARGLARDQVEARVVRADAGATYDRTFHVDLSTLEPMVATPGDPRQGTPLSRLRQERGTVRVDIAYGGSCTGGKLADMEAYAAVLREGRRRGMRVPTHVQLYIQVGSQRVRRAAEEAGYLEVFREAGARVLEPGCGACIRAGPGVSQSAEQVTISAANRNFPGRSGPGQVFLASPAVVAASALAGHVTSPGELWGAPEP
jgi:3-isopropylmalate/(R)-2-methylmalate dehydratase large subunit